MYTFNVPEVVIETLVFDVSFCTLYELYIVSRKGLLTGQRINIRFTNLYRRFTHLCPDKFKRLFSYGTGQGSLFTSCLQICCGKTLPFSRRTPLSFLHGYIIVPQDRHLSICQGS